MRRNVLFFLEPQEPRDWYNRVVELESHELVLDMLVWITTRVYV